MKRTRTRIGAAALAATTLLLAGCGGEDLAESDPRGAEACEKLIDSVRYEEDVEQRMGNLLGAGKAAVKARTQAIQDAVNEPIEGLEDFPVVNEDKLREACEDAGVEIPETSR